MKRNNFPVFCKDIFPVDAYGRWQITDYGKPIKMKGKNGNVKVNQGDIIFADGDAVICIHKNVAKKVLKYSLIRLKKENMIRKEIKNCSLNPKNINKLYKKVGRW